MYFWLLWIFIAAHGLSLVAARGATLRSSAWASRCAEFSCCRASTLGFCGLGGCSSQTLEPRLSCGAQAQLLHGMWALPGPGVKPVSPALAGGFLSTAPPGKSSLSILMLMVLNGFLSYMLLLLLLFDHAVVSDSL